MLDHNYPELPQISKEGYLQLWSEFQTKAKAELLKSKDKVRENLIVWTSELSKPENIERCEDILDRECN
jgi:hypothetical protein